MKDKIGCQQNRCRRDGEEYETVLGTRAIHDVETFDLRELKIRCLMTLILLPLIELVCESKQVRFDLLF